MSLLHRKKSIERRKKARPVSAIQENKEKTKKIKNELKGNKQIEGEEKICCVCNSPIKKGQLYSDLIPDTTHEYDRYYHQSKCGPGTENWYKFHPSEIAYSLWKNNDRRRKKWIITSKVGKI